MSGKNHLSHAIGFTLELYDIKKRKGIKCNNLQLCEVVKDFL